MAKSARKVNGPAEGVAADAATNPGPGAAVGAAIESGLSAIEALDRSWQSRDIAVATAASVLCVGGCALVFEAALIPGMALGVAAALAPQFAPRIGSALNPVFHATVRNAYRLCRRSRQVWAQAQDRLRDLPTQASATGEAKSRHKAVAAPREAQAAAT